MWLCSCARNGNRLRCRITSSFATNGVCANREHRRRQYGNLKRYDGQPQVTCKRASHLIGFDIVQSHFFFFSVQRLMHLSVNNEMDEKRSPGAQRRRKRNADEDFRFFPSNLLYCVVGSSLWVLLLFVTSHLCPARSRSLTCSTRTPTVSHKRYLVIRSSGRLWAFLFLVVLFSRLSSVEVSYVTNEIETEWVSRRLK